MRKRFIVSTIITLAFLFTAGCSRKAELSQQEKSLLLTVEDLARYDKGKHDPSRGRFVKEIDPQDQSVSLVYEYESQKGTDEPPLYISCTLDIDPKSSDTTFIKSAIDIGFWAGFKSQCVKEVPINNYPSYGKRSKFSLLTMDEKPIGNLFVVEYDRKVITILISGICIDKASIWQEIADKKINLIQKYEVP